VKAVKEAPPKLSIIDIRQVHWGMSRDQVKETEKGIAISKGDDSIYYQETLLEYPVVLNYFFKNDRLVSAVYDFSQKYPDNELNKFIDDFNIVKEALIKKYGEPNTDTHVWKNSALEKAYQNKPKEFGFMVKIGGLEYFSKWEKDNTAIMLSLKGEQSGKMREIVLKLSYEAKKEIADKF
jgi:hypothetical protein